MIVNHDITLSNSKLVLDYCPRLPRSGFLFFCLQLVSQDFWLSLLNLFPTFRSYHTTQIEFISQCTCLWFVWYKFRDWCGVMEIMQNCAQKWDLHPTSWSQSEEHFPQVICPWEHEKILHFKSHQSFPLSCNHVGIDCLNIASVRWCMIENKQPSRLLNEHPSWGTSRWRSATVVHYSEDTERWN